VQVFKRCVHLATGQAGQRQRGAGPGVVGVFLAGLDKIFFCLLGIAILQVGLACHGVQIGIHIRAAQPGQQGCHGLGSLTRAQVDRDQHPPRQRDFGHGVECLVEIGFGLNQRVQLHFHRTRQLQALHVIGCKFQHLLNQLPRLFVVLALKCQMRLEQFGLRVRRRNFFHPLKLRDRVR